MSARRGETDLCGILAVDKPSGMTSHDVVNRIRRATGERRVGHAGTLDPMATGLLVVLVGPATRLAPYLTSAEKTYAARIVFGKETDTDDADGRVTVTSPVPDVVLDPLVATETVAALVGAHQQLPPAFSAIKRDGKVAYEAARAGEAMVLEPRRIEVVSARLLSVTEGACPSWDVEFSVSKGTYIRALARDLGRSLGTAAHLGALERTRSGNLDLAHARSLDQIALAHDVTELFCDPLRSLGLDVVDVDAGGVARVAVGAVLDRQVDDTRQIGQNVAVAHEGNLLAIYRVLGDTLRPLAVIPGGVKGTA